MEYLLTYLQEGAPKAENEGFINVHFVINCDGTVGRIGLELLDRKYKPTEFKPELVKHITDKILKIKSWDNFKIDPYYGSKDVKAFVVIKIGKNKILDVGP